jgi:putative transposase
VAESRWAGDDALSISTGARSSLVSQRAADREWSALAHRNAANTVAAGRSRTEVAVPNYRRWYVAGGTFFFTLVTHGRRKFLTNAASRALLRAAIRKERGKRPFTIVAWVLLPDHLHTVWTLPQEDDQYSRRWQKIKEEFTKTYLAASGHEGIRSRSRRRRRERAVWQRRFWEHTVRDEQDLQRCVDYVHWNPVKHGLAGRVRDWPWSTFHRFVAAGDYDIDWGASDPFPGYEDPEWGE